MDESHLPELSKLHDALNVVCDFLEAHGFPYALAGGMAVAVWGEPRATFDVDLVVAIRVDAEEGLLSAIRNEPAFILEPQTLPMPPEIKIVCHIVARSPSAGDDRRSSQVGLLRRGFDCLETVVGACERP
jgi:hypothetical protein